MIDSHCHLDYFVFQKTLPSVIERAFAAGVSQMITVGTHKDDWEIYKKIAEENSGFIFWTMGLHPTEINDDYKIHLERFQTMFADEQKNPSLVAIGEIGLDEHWMPENLAKAEELRILQKEVFKIQLEIVRESQLPIIIHGRKAFQQCFQIINDLRIDWERIVFHCFDGSPEDVLLLNKKGGRASFTGIVTYPSAHLTRETILAQGLDRLMLETDAPFLAPQGYRGQKNEPAFVQKTAEFVAKLFNVSFLEINDICDKNTRSFFSLPKSS